MAKQKFVSQEGKLEKLGTPDTSGGEAMVSYMKALPFDHIIGAPLMACIKAQQASAQATWEAIREIGFEKSDTADPASTKEEEVAMVNFLFQQNGFTRKISVPLLTLIPIPYMQIDSVDLKFRADMSTSSDGSIKAKYSNTMDSEAARTSKYNVTNEIDINIHATTSGMPAGIAKMLEIFTSSCINVVDYNPEDYSQQLIDAAKQEAERIKAEAKAEAEGKVQELLQSIKDKGVQGPTYSISLTMKPEKNKIPEIANTITGVCSKATYDDIVNSLSNSTGYTIAKGVTAEEKANICMTLEKIGISTTTKEES
jgi:hypothetical protein